MDIAPLWDDRAARTLLRAMFDAAVGAADPLTVLADHLPDKPKGRCVVVGAGKASATMALAVERAWPDVQLSGAVVVPYGHGCATSRIAVREAAHPVPDANSEAAAREMLGLVAGLGADDLVLALISGGGSSVMALPAVGITLAEKQAVNRALLASGLDIRTMNAVRRRLSGIKGGKLAAAAGSARVVTLTISDIPGDDAAAIASGPTLPDPDAARDLSDLAAQLKPQVSEAVHALLVAPVVSSSVQPVADVRIIATPQRSLEAAAAVARAAGVAVEMLGDDLEGESRELAGGMARAIGEGRSGGPRVLLSGGETTVTLTGARGGRGGRNTEFALALALAMDGRPGVWCIAADTDGEDGASGGGAGAIVTPDTLARAHAMAIDPRRSLDDHDSGTLFEALGDLIVTGPTRTNVNDFRAILVAGSAA
ncbi:glycerate kinase type-2 family protein [Sphingomonas turrisvirgatae]|uniref:Hydroxypyruvate reductase n=1 Tax=Sphingomonas turrisvirgatae TaxID=1888892 RepID=A0A1E3LY35_9SPHN|nr:glycerate kinase [Sphingomonas turrisvirgatae]ODP38697.1 hydroxypyruvate reductase [Sphingomonas turrisvirgatae]